MTETPEQTPPAKPVRYPDDDLAGLAAALEPYLRAHFGAGDASDLTAVDVLVDARPREVVDALYAAGYLVDKDTTDRAHLRKSWAAMSTALIHLADYRRLSPDVLTAVPKSHQVYLMGHEARAEQLAEAWRRQLGARNLAERILSRGTPPTPAEIGEIAAELGGDNPYANTVRPEGADPWWGCWTDPAAVPQPFGWERYERTIDPDAQIDGTGDLCQFLGGTWSKSPESESITAKILKLIEKAQATPERFEPIARAFPREVTAWRTWMSMSPAPTARELYAELAGERVASRMDRLRYKAETWKRAPVLAPAGDAETLHRQDAAAAYEGAGGAGAGQLVPPAAVPAGEADTLADRIISRALLLLDCLDETREGAAEIRRGKLPADLRALVPAGARSYALPWPAGTRADYDPALVVLRETGRDRTGMADTEVVSRTLFVKVGDGVEPDGHFPVGTVRLLEHKDKRGRRWWQCRHCNLGATGCVSPEAERAECFGHEAICPDQDRLANTRVPRDAGRPRSAVSPGDPDWVAGFGPVPGASLGSLGEDQ